MLCKEQRTAGEVQQATAMYLAQRDAKAALRWIVANAIFIK